MRRFSLPSWLCCLPALLFAMPAMAQAPIVTVSIKPLHSIVAFVMKDTGAQPSLIVTGNASPHGFQLKPSQMQAVAHADAVFYVANNFESFLMPALRQMDPKAIAVPVGQQAVLLRLPKRAGGLWEIEEDSIPAAKMPTDWHLWLSPGNAGAMAQYVAETLAARYPEHKEKYLENAADFRFRLQALDGELRRGLTPLKGKPYVVFHDAYHYFEERYDLSPLGTITLEPDMPVSALRLAQLRQKIRQAKAVCIFREPQFPSPLADTVAEGTMARTALLDPEGSTITPGPELYETLLKQLAAQFARCLGPQS